MSFFQNLINTKYNNHHDGRNLWEYSLNYEEFEELINELNNETKQKDPRDITLYFAEWWKWKYDGGTPSKEMVFNSLPNNFRIRIGGKDEFFNLARNGARSLGVNWLKVQNTLYFRSLLLQGGLPLTHIKNNKGSYLNFLKAVMDAQPHSIEDFMFDSSITNHLPQSSRNEVIYENCLEIVKAILYDEDSIYKDLLSTDKTLIEINEDLIKYRRNIQIRERLLKPKVDWILNLEDEPEVYLNLGFNDKYTPLNLGEIIGFEATHSSYQLYSNDNLICSFHKTTGGHYRIRWHHQGNYKLSDMETIPHFNILYTEEDEIITKPIHGLIQNIPDFNLPTLWSYFSESRLKLVKGNATSNDRGVIISPTEWSSYFDYEILSINDQQLKKTEFEGECIITNGDEKVKFLSDVSSFDWSIIDFSESSDWLIKSNMISVRNVPQFFFYDEKGEKVENKYFSIQYRGRNTGLFWENLNRNTTLPIGCIDLKIVKGEVVAYDTIFNLGNFNLDYKEQSLTKAEINVYNPNKFQVNLYECQNINVEENQNGYHLSLNPELRQLPKYLKIGLKLGTDRSLIMNCESPFTGARIMDAEGNILEPGSTLNLRNLFGYRILKPHKQEAFLQMKNELREEVVVSKILHKNSQPLLTYLEEFSRLFALADQMNHENQVSLEIKYQKKSVHYIIKNHTEILNVENQEKKQVKTENNLELELFAIPLNCFLDDIRPIPLLKAENYYSLYHCESEQMVIVSAEDDKGNFMLPRYVNTDPYYQGLSQEERLKKYHEALSNSNFDSRHWLEMLKYFKICNDFDLAYSTFDQLRALLLSSKTASRAFFFLLINQHEPENFILNDVPKLERDLGFCFHWIAKDDWQMTFVTEVLQSPIYGSYANNLAIYLKQYFENNDLLFLNNFIQGNNIDKVTVLNPDFQSAQMQLGERVLNEIPQDNYPEVNKDYGFPNYNNNLELIVRSSVAVGESILASENASYSLWSQPNNMRAVRRNVQYVQYLAPTLYRKIIQQVLTY